MGVSMVIKAATGRARVSMEDTMWTREAKVNSMEGETTRQECMQI